MSLRDDGLTEEASDGYFASVSDLMVGVLFVFLLMLTIFALNYRDDSTKLADVIAQEHAAEVRARAAEDAALIAQRQAEDERRRAEQQARLAAQERDEAARQAALAARERQEAERLRAQNEALRQHLKLAADTLQQELRDREQVRADLLHRLADRLQRANIRFDIDPRSGVLRLSDAIPFATGHADLGEPRASQTVQVLAHVLADVLPCFAAGAPQQACEPSDAPILETVLVEGHTDRQTYANMMPVQSEQENDRLSAERALTVFTEMRRQQPELDALRNPDAQPLLGISGYGQRRPLPDALTSAEADFTRNRRIDIRFVLATRTSDQLRQLLSEIAALETPAR